MCRYYLFLGKIKDNGEWVEGNYFHNIRKGEAHYIITKDDNERYVVDSDTVGQFIGKYSAEDKKK